MRIAIIGAGPTGLFMGMVLAGRGHPVTVVDRDPGPAADGTWPRRGVMQFHHAHGFRGQVAAALREEIPEAYDRWLEAGAEPVLMPGPGGADIVVGMRSRRIIFEKALRQTALEQAGLNLHIGHVQRVTSDAGRATGVEVDGTHLPADLVIDASGRSSPVTSPLGAREGMGGSTRIAYVDRQYQLHRGAEPGPMLNPIAWQAEFDGYQVIVFPHEHGVFSVLVVRQSDDRDLAKLRYDTAFQAACVAIPGLAEWTDPDRSRPITPVLPGGNLLNHYRGQRTPEGELVLPGLLFLGDAVCTTTPIFGRGITTCVMQAREVLRLLDEGEADMATLAEVFDDWSEREMRPWVEDHVRMDTDMRDRWDGKDIDLDQPLPSDLVMAAGEIDPSITEALQPYLGMRAGPASIQHLQERAKAVYATGWRNPLSPGPSRDELAAIVAHSLAGESVA